MCLRIRRVVKLPWDVCPLDFLRQLLRPLDRTLHALCALREDDLRAVSPQNIPALHAHGLRHCEDRTVAFCRRDRRKPDACIAACRLDDNGAFSQQTFFLRRPDHAEGCPVLHAPCGVSVLELCEHPRFQAVRALHVDGLHEGRFADDLCKSFIHCHFNLFLS